MIQKFMWKIRKKVFRAWMYEIVRDRDTEMLQWFDDEVHLCHERMLSKARLMQLAAHLAHKELSAQKENRELANEAERLANGQ